MALNQNALRVFTFSPRWGLPTSGPFALKLLAWLNQAGIAYEQAYEDQPGKGPMGKSPWIEQGNVRMGDSDAIIRHLTAQHGLPDPTAVTNAAEARADAIKTAFEERFHQILEWELFVYPAGFAEIRGIITDALPPVIGGLAASHMRRHFTRQLHARGMGRLPAGEIASAGRRQLDGLALCLGDGGGRLGNDEFSLADFAVWGQVAPILCWPMETPVANHARSLPQLRDWHERIMLRCYEKP
jgi:glutathione S-transferase